MEAFERCHVFYQREEKEVYVRRILSLVAEQENPKYDLE